MIQIIGKGGMARELRCYVGEHVLAEFDEIKHFSKDIKTIIAIGNGYVRKKISEEYPELNYTTLSFGILHDEVEMGEGSLICPGVRVTCGVRIGKHVIINNNSTIGHEETIGDFSTIAPAVNLCGNVTIGKRCYIGSNTVIREKLTICDDVIIGCGSVVVKDITEPGVYVGNPCKKIKQC